MVYATLSSTPTASSSQLCFVELLYDNHRAHHLFNGFQITFCSDKTLIVGACINVCTLLYFEAAFPKEAKAHLMVKNKYKISFSSARLGIMTKCNFTMKPFISHVHSLLRQCSFNQLKESAKIYTSSLYDLLLLFLGVFDRKEPLQAENGATFEVSQSTKSNKGTTPFAGQG